jgi:hypothetical protein
VIEPDRFIGAEALKKRFVKGERRAVRHSAK